MMAGHTLETWEVAEKVVYGWCVVKGYDVLAPYLTEKRARRIVRDHNMHERMLDALKAAVAQSLITMRDGSGRKSCRYCARIGEHNPVCVFAGLVRVIAEAEKGD